MPTYEWYEMYGPKRFIAAHLVQTPSVPPTDAFLFSFAGIDLPEGVLDLTDPTAPALLVQAMVSVTAVLGVPAADLAAGKKLLLEADLGAASLTHDFSLVPGIGGLSGTKASYELAGSWLCAAEDTLDVRVIHNLAAASSMRLDLYLVIQVIP